MLSVEKSLDSEQLTITVGKESSGLLHSLLEYCTRHDFKGDVTGEELGLAKILSDELHFYITHNKSEELELEAINYINDSYK